MSVEQSFWRAVDTPENLDFNGNINWSYVDADIWMENGDECMNMGESKYSSVWADLIDSYERIRGKIELKYYNVKEVGHA